MFPYVYYGSFCKRVHRDYPDLVPEAFKDDLLKISGSIIIKYKWRVGFVIASGLALIVQMLLIF
jgi:hypothetical protein